MPEGPTFPVFRKQGGDREESVLLKSFKPAVYNWKAQRAVPCLSLILPSLPSSTFCHDGCWGRSRARTGKDQDQK